jgi:hypothetical protein
VLKLLLLSILLMTYFLPILSARVGQPRRALATLLALVLIGEVCYALFLLVIYPRLV